jgi:L-threonylcarbamoyladenylate synthase
LSDGALAAFPTETVYGLGADATNPHAIAALYAAKGRPRFNPLIAHVRDFADAQTHAHLSATAEALAARFWPGPLTLVAPRRAHSAVCELACAGLATIALRAPAHPVAQALLQAFGAPIAAPSANRSGKLSPTRADHVEADLGDAAALVLDGGACPIGIESTIVAAGEDGALTLLRAGAISRAEIEAVSGPLHAPTHEGVAAPGMLASHYAPRAALRLNAVAAEPGEAMLGFGAIAGDASLSPRGDVQEAAANLYAALRALDAAGAAAIAVAPIPEAGLGEAINDRLRRAAAPRD